MPHLSPPLNNDTQRQARSLRDHKVRARDGGAVMTAEAPIVAGVRAQPARRLYITAFQVVCRALPKSVLVAQCANGGDETPASFDLTN